MPWSGSEWTCSRTQAGSRAEQAGSSQKAVEGQCFSLTASGSSMIQEARSSTESEEWGEGSGGLRRKEKGRAGAYENNLGKRLIKGKSFASILEDILCLRGKKSLHPQRESLQKEQREFANLTTSLRRWPF